MSIANSIQLHAVILALFGAFFLETSAFSPILPTQTSTYQYQSNVNVPFAYDRKNKLHLFRKVFGGKSDGEEEEKEDGEGDQTKEPTSTRIEKSDEEETVPFFARLTRRNKSSNAPEVATRTITKSSTASSLDTSSPSKKVYVETLSPLEKAKALKAQAQRTRLEAEKMDVMLTLEKIEKLETKINTKAVSDDQDLEDELKKQIQALKLKLGGDTKKEENQDGTRTTNTNLQSTHDVPKKDLDSVLSAVVNEARTNEVYETMSSKEIQEKIEKFNAAPKFMQDLVVKAAGMETENLNATALVLKMYDDEKSVRVEAINGVPAVNANVPEFTQEQIDEVLDVVKMVPQFVKNLYGDEMKNNDTAIALMMLEEEWRSGDLVVMPEITQTMIDEKLTEYSWVPQMLRGDNDTELAIELIKSDARRSGKKSLNAPSPARDQPKDSTTKTENESSGGGSGLFGAFGQDKDLKSDTEQMIESLFPESTRKEGEEINEGQAVLFMSEVLANDNTWAATGAPEKVPGGFLVRGSTRYETGAELIDAIDKNMEKSRVRNKVTCFYVFDPTPVTEEQMNDGDRPPVLYITAPNVVRDPAPIQRSLISAVAFGTIWYNSLLPFLLNDKYMKMADEQLALADASMASNVDFLTDLSFPLFAATVGIQAVHEIAHIIAASSNDMNITIPTLVPSIGTGLLGGITSLQSAPKNKQALFDFAIAGPLAGMAVSAALLFIGMTTTASMDAATYSNLPGLPLNVLRQSSLVSGIIDSFNPGLLAVPDAAIGSAALAEINIPLHPFAIAGYFGMMINAVNLLPMGRTDGGRVGLALFGRSGAQLVSFVALAFMFIQGITGSDLLLFYFSFAIFFQSELEVPQRNEVDDLDFSRVLLATATGVLVLLTLIPM